MTNSDKKLEELIEGLESDFLHLRSPGCYHYGTDIRRKETLRILNLLKSMERVNWKPIYIYFKNNKIVQGVLKEYDYKLDKMILSEGK
jgi:hypothetical protein